MSLRLPFSWHSSFTIFLFFIFMLPLIAQSDFVASEYLSVPSSEFVSTIESTIGILKGVVSIVFQFVNQFGDDLRLSNAINDCVDLLDYTGDELNFALSAVENSNGRDTNNSNSTRTGNLKADLKAWLSAALGNQDTCLDGFDGTNSFVKSIIGASFGQLTSQVSNILGMVSESPSPKTKRANKFPAWMTLKDRRLLDGPSSGVPVDVVVAMDGTGKYTNINDAILSAPDYSTRRYVLYVKKGVYKENVEIKKKKWNLMIIGDGADVTVISGSRNFIDGWTTFRSATFAVSGRGFIARDITFENTAGPEKHQAVSLRSDSDLSAFYRCNIRGYQDTLYAHSLRQFYRECNISGTVDFIFGNGAAVFQNCVILAKKGLPNQKNTITAQGRKDPNQTTGFSIQFSKVIADKDLLASMNGTQTYLGRPWKQYSRTVVLQSYMSDIIKAEGWLEWQGNFALDTLYYGEYMNYGPGAGVGNRVKWPGYRVLNSTQATTFTVAQFIDGMLWLPATGVKFTAGLVN